MIKKSLWQESSAVMAVNFFANVSVGNQPGELFSQPAGV